MPQRPFPLALTCALLAPAAAAAHNLVVKAVLRAEQPGSVRVEAYFDDRSPAQEAPVTVRDAAGTAVASGTTDETGLWAFPRPKPGRYTVRVSSVGHANEAELVIEDEKTLGTFGSWEPNRVAGAAVGLTLLLGLSYAYWRRTRR